VSVSSKSTGVRARIRPEAGADARRSSADFERRVITADRPREL
jgi:hypothetical protein